MKKYLITAAQYGASPNKPFLSNLEAYAKKIQAEIVVLPMDGCYKDDTDLHWYIKENYTVINSTKKLNDNIKIDAYQVRPQQMDPVTGLGRFAQDDCSSIFASPKQRMRVLPNSNIDLPKIIMTTGACTKPYYKENTRMGRIAKKDHVYGAVLVEVKDKTFYQYRHIDAANNGTFYDLGTRVMDKRATKRRPEAMVLGDWHHKSTCPLVKRETLSMIGEYKPKRVFFHDLFDAKSISHHEDGQIISKVHTHVTKGLSLSDELRSCAAELYGIASKFPKTEFVIVKSNHDEHLFRYLNEARFIKEPQNAHIGAKLLVKAIEGQDPLVAGLNMFFKMPKNVKFLTRDDDYRVHGYQLANHGDSSFNGARGGINALEAANGKCIVGHRHSPEKYRNIYIVGTSTVLKLDYNSGFSSWLNTSAFLYDNAKVQLFNFIKGKHRF